MPARLNRKFPYPSAASSPDSALPSVAISAIVRTEAVTSLNIAGKSSGAIAACSTERLMASLMQASFKRRLTCSDPFVNCDDECEGAVALPLSIRSPNGAPHPASRATGG